MLRLGLLSFNEDLVRVGATIAPAGYDVFQRAKDMRTVPEAANGEELAVQRRRREFKLPQADTREVVHLVREPENPGDLSVWGIAYGVTSAAKSLSHAPQLAQLSTIAGRVLVSQAR